MKDKKGFTLIELLAIIVILAIIAVITVPLILGIIDESKEKASISSAYGFKDAVEKHYVKGLLDNQTTNLNGTYTITNGMINNEEIPASGTKPTNGILTYQNNKLVSGCLTIDGYKLIYENDKFVSNGKGSCGPEEGYIACSDDEYIHEEKTGYELLNIPTNQSLCEAFVIAEYSVDNQTASAYCSGETITVNNNDYSFETDFEDYTNIIEKLEKAELVEYNSDAYAINNTEVGTCEYVFTMLGLSSSNAQIYCSGGEVDDPNFTSFDNDVEDPNFHSTLDILASLGAAVPSGETYVLDNNATIIPCELAAGWIGLSSEQATSFCSGNTVTIEEQNMNIYSAIEDSHTANAYIELGIIRQVGEPYTLNNSKKVTHCMNYVKNNGLPINNGRTNLNLSEAVDYCNGKSIRNDSIAFDPTMQDSHFSNEEIQYMLNNSIIKETIEKSCRKIEYVYYDSNTEQSVESETLPQNKKVYIMKKEKDYLCGVESGERFCLSDDYSENVSTLNNLYNCQEEEEYELYIDKGITLLGYRPNNSTVIPMSLSPSTIPARFTCTGGDLTVQKDQYSIKIDDGTDECTMYNDDSSYICGSVIQNVQ